MTDAITIDGLTYTRAGDTFGDLPASAYVVCEYLTIGRPNHVHKGPTPVMRSFTMFADGSGCSALVNVYGRVVRCDYRQGEFRAEDCPPKRDRAKRWQIDGAVKLAREAFIARFELAEPRGWREMHAALYAA